MVLTDHYATLKAMAVRDRELPCGCEVVVAVERAIVHGELVVGEPTLVRVPCQAHDSHEIDMRISDAWSQPKNARRFKDMPCEDAYAILFEELST